MTRSIFSDSLALECNLACRHFFLIRNLVFLFAANCGFPVKWSATSQTSLVTFNELYLTPWSGYIYIYTYTYIYIYKCVYIYIFINIYIYIYYINSLSFPKILHHIPFPNFCEPYILDLPPHPGFQWLNEGLAWDYLLKMSCHPGIANSTAMARGAHAKTLHTGMLSESHSTGRNTWCNMKVAYVRSLGPLIKPKWVSQFHLENLRTNRCWGISCPRVPKIKQNWARKLRPHSCPQL